MKNKGIAINSKYLISKTYHIGHLGVGKVGKKPYPDDTSYNIAYVECSRFNFCALITKGYWYFTLSWEQFPNGSPVMNISLGKLMVHSLGLD